MILDSDSLEFIEKSLTRTDAKKVHKDLPEGGVWRTMSGHHIYIVNGKIVAGSVPGVTKAKKMTKATMAEHQAKIDAEGKKKGAKNESATTKKATGNTSKKPGGNPGGAKGAKGTKTVAGKPAKAVEPPAKGTKADGTATKPTSKTKTGTKGAKSSANVKSTGNGKSVSGVKNPSSEGKPKSAAKGNKGASGADFFKSEIPGISRISFKDAGAIVRAWRKKGTVEMYGHDINGYSLFGDEILDNQDKDTAKKHGLKPKDLFGVAVLRDGKGEPVQLMNYSMTTDGVDINILETAPGEHGKGYGKKMVAHAVELSNKFGAGGKVTLEADNNSHPFYKKLGFTSLGDNEELNSENAQKLLESVMGKKIAPPKLAEEPDDVQAKRQEQRDKIQSAKGSEVEEPLELYHGTTIPSVDKIIKGGFKLNGGHSDFGHAAYFKSPTFDHKDKADFQKWIDDRRAKGQPVPDRYLTGDDMHGYDTKNIVRFFSDRKDPAVIKAVIPKKHVLDCSNGRPKELQKLIKDHEKHELEGTKEAMMGYTMKHALGMNVEGKDANQLKLRWDMPDTQKKLKEFFGRQIQPFKVSPYEIYAKKNGIAAIVDKLDVFKEEGWQIGVYDPKLIQIKDTGKGLNRTDKGVELLKALNNSSKAMPYCLLHHEMTDEGLVMHVGAQGGEEDLEKSINRTQAKAIHKELPPGGEWKTVKGHHIYIKDGKVLAGSIPGVTEGKAKKATKAQLKEHQDVIDKAAKGNAKGKGKTTSGSSKDKKAGVAKKGAEAKAKAPAKPAKAVETPKKPATKTKTTKGAGKNAKVDEKPNKAPKGVSPGADNKPTPAGKSKPSAKQAPKKAGTAKSSKSEPAKKTKDIRHEAQKNRELAYDAGEKIGGARKDEFIASFKAKPTPQSLAEMEKMSGAVAEKMVTKANLLPKFDWVEEQAKGTELQTAMLKKLLYDRIAPKPEPSNPATRAEYLNALTKFQRQIGGIKTWEQMQGAIRELRDYARGTSTKNLASTASSIKYHKHRAETGKEYIGSNWDIKPEERQKSKERAAEFEDKLMKYLAMKKAFNFESLGEKFNNFFTNWDSMDRTIQTINKNVKDGWEKYTGEKPKAAPKKERGAENKKWERKAEAEDLRTGGKKVKMDKPEQLMKEFGLRGVEFGNWVNDSSGKYHLQRSAEALSDLADIIGIDPKDVSLNGRLALAFGARGKGGALAHYEPDRKVINMTKYGGAGSLAHEWGHAMDNIIHQYSEGGRESLGHASDLQMGDHDPILTSYYHDLMDAITKPVPGDKGASTQLILDSSAKSLSRYYPEMRRQIQDGMNPADVYQHWAGKINAQYDRYVANAKSSTLRSPSERDKAVKQYEQKRKRELSDIGHHLAHELRRKQNGNSYGGEHYKGHIEIPTGNSEYYQRMIETQPGKMQNGTHYYSQPPELFARVFESYVQDKLDKAKRYNNYLVHGTREGNVKAEGAPFPLGKERKRMFEAMERLMQYVTQEKALKKALEMDLMKSATWDEMFDYFKDKLKDGESIDGAYEEAVNHFDRDYGEEMDFRSYLKKKGYEVQKHFWVNKGLSTGLETKRSAYNVANPEECIYIPLNRLRTVYQTEKATNWDKVMENHKRMIAGENLEPVSIGLDYDVHDGHHRIEASRKMGYEHVPCIVKGGNDIERKRAIEAYREVWKSIQTDPVAPDAFEDDEPYMFRGIGQKEMDFIRKNGYIQTKGKGNDDDKDAKTCFSNLYSQAAGYARSNYDLYNEKQAYVLALPKLEGFEDETGEIAIPGRVSIIGMKVIPIPKEIQQP